MSNWDLIDGCGCGGCTEERKNREAAEKAAEPRRTLLVSEVLRGDPCYVYQQKLNRFEAGTIEVSVSLAVAQAEDWDWYWAASHLLTEKGYEKFTAEATKASDEKYKQLEPYQEIARVQQQAALAEYDRIRDQILAANGSWNRAYDEANKVYRPLVEVSDAATAAARKVIQTRVNKTNAKIFAELYISEEGTEEPTGNDNYDNYEDYDEYEDY